MDQDGVREIPWGVRWERTRRENEEAIGNRSSFFASAFILYFCLNEWDSSIIDRCRFSANCAYQAQPRATRHPQRVDECARDRARRPVALTQRRPAPPAAPILADRASPARSSAGAPPPPAPPRAWKADNA